MSSTSIQASKQVISPPDSQTKIGSNVDLRQKVLLGNVKFDDQRKQSIFQINQNSEIQSSYQLLPTQFIQRDLMVLGMNQSSKEMYTKKNWKNLGDFNISTGTAIGVVEEIIQKGSDILYDKYLNEKQYMHVFKSIMYLSELSWQQERLVHDLDFDLKKQKNYFNYPPEDYLDKYKDIIIEDLEPEPPGRENRRNYNVEIEKKVVEIDVMEDSITKARQEVIDKLIQQSSAIKRKKKKRDRSNQSKDSLQNLSKDQLQLSKNNSHYSSRQSSPHQSQSIFQSVKEVQSMNLAEDELVDREAQLIQSYNQCVFDNYNPRLVNLFEVQEIDRVEEQLRLLKEREIELKQQKEEFEALRLLEQKEQQLRLKNVQKGENDKKQIAYDFNGQVIGVQPAKAEKFPQSTIVVGHSVSKGEVSTIDYSAQSKALQKQMKKKLKQQDQDDISSADQLSNNQQTPTARQYTFRSKDSVQTNTKPTNQNIVTAFMKNKKDGYQPPPQKEAVFHQQQEIFEIFKANKGVTFIEGGRVKKGPNFHTITNSIDLSRMVEKDYGKNIYITKNDYNKLVGGLNTSIDSELGANMSRVSSQNSQHSKSAANIRQKTDQNDIRLPLNLLTNSSGITPKSVPVSKQNKKQGQNIFTSPNNINNSNIHEIFDQNLSQSHLVHQSINDVSRSNLNVSSMSKKKNYFNSQKKLKPIDSSKISVQSMEILQNLALDDYEYVLQVLNQNPAEIKRGLASPSNKSDFYNKNRNQDISQQSQSGGLDHQNSRSILNDVSANRSLNNQNYSINSSINNMSGISPSQQNNNQQNQKQQLQKPRIAPLQRPTDEYNRAIISGSIDWGNPTIDSARSNSSAIPNFKPDTQYKQKHTLGNHGKFPRERLMKKSLNEMSHDHLSPPQIGSTMGYGAGKGFHPDKLITVKQFIQELNASNNQIQQQDISQIKQKQNS